MGLPRKGKKLFTMWLTPEQHVELEKAAYSRHMVKGEYLKMLITKDKPELARIFKYERWRLV